MRNQTCCFTGHRKIPPKALPALSAQLEATVRELIASGIDHFIVGGAVGFDTIAGETVLQLRNEFPHIKLSMALPYPDMDLYWPREDAFRHLAILTQADDYKNVSERYHRGCMHERNRYMVDNSSICVAYCTRPTGGSAYTVRYAKKQGLKLIMLGKE